MLNASELNNQIPYWYEGRPCGYVKSYVSNEGEHAGSTIHLFIMHDSVETETLRLLDEELYKISTVAPEVV